MLVVCERWVGDGDRLLHIEPKFFWQQHFFRILAWLLNRGSLRAQALCLKLVLTPATCPQLTPAATGTKLTHASRLWHLVIWLFFIHLLHVGVRISTKFNHVHRSRWYFDIFDRMHLFRCNTGAYLDWRFVQGSICYTRGEMAKVLGCSLEVSKFELSSRYWVYFRKGMNPSTPVMG